MRRHAFFEREKDMTHKLLLAAIAVMAVGASAQTLPSPGDNGAAVGNGHRVRITYENLTAGQPFSPSVFVSHNRAAPPMFMEGQPASFGLMRLAEEGNVAPLADGAAATLGGAFGSAIIGLPTLPGHSRTIVLEVTAEHPMVSGVFMLGRTNDGFSGVSAINAFSLRRPITIEAYAWDAGTENNNERGSDLIAMMGTGRDPENGVVQRHRGIRGDADAPGTWKFDPSRPVVRITIVPVGR
jgi:hypothetical protein